MSKFYHIVHLYKPNDLQALTRIAFAKRSWQQFDWVFVPHVLEEDDRDSSDIGELRRCPYLKDVLNKYWHTIPNDGIIILTNTDTCLVPETDKILKYWFKKHDCCWSCRYDFSKVTYLMKFKQISRGQFYVGKDLFAFRKSWWPKDFPDLLLGCPGWDWLLYKLMGEDKGIKPVVYHERHTAQWTYGGLGNEWNLKLIKEYANKKGIPYNAIGLFLH